MPEVRILGVRVEIIDKNRLQRRIAESIVQARKDVFTYVNVHGMNLARRDEWFREFLNTAAVVYCDGEGVRVGARILGKHLQPRVVLTYWIWDLCRFCAENGFKIYLLGSSPEHVELAVKNLCSRYPEITVAGYHHGHFAMQGPENEEVIRKINSTRPHLLFVGFGMPTQEHWIKENLDRLEVNAVLPAGSMIDYVAGRKRFAPAWMSNHGMEWFYRLFQEPRRLAWRYVVGNPLFIMRVLIQRLTSS